MAHLRAIVASAMINLIHKIHIFMRTREARRAVLKKNLVALERALYLGADPNGVVQRYPRNFRGRREHFLHRAVHDKWIEGIETLIQAGADLEKRGGISYATPFFLAIEGRDRATIWALTECGPDPNGIGWSVDHAALNRTLNTLGWDYPRQGSLVSVREMTAAELAAHFLGEEGQRIIARADELHHVKVQAREIDAGTPEATATRPAHRL